MLIEETYEDARGLCLSGFWDDILYHKDTMPLLCESYVRKIQSSLGLSEEDALSTVDLTECVPQMRLEDSKEMESLSEKDTPDKDANEETILESPSPAVLSSSCELIAAPSFEASLVPSDSASSSANGPSSETTSIIESSKADEPMITDEEVPLADPTPTKDELDMEDDAVLPEPPPVISSSPYALLPSSSSKQSDLPFSFEAIGGCCLNCPCHKSRSDTSIANENTCKKSIADDIAPYPFHMRRSAFSDDKVGQRVQQIAHILRNLSFESDNASIMGNNSTLLR